MQKHNFTQQFHFLSNKQRYEIPTEPTPLSRGVFRVLSNTDFCVHKQPPEVFYKKGVLKNFTKFTGKNLCQSLFFNKVAG